MPTYVYGCDKNKDHPKVEIVHRVGDNPETWCSVCHSKMHRVPQPFVWGWHPSIGLIDHMERKYTEWRTKKQQAK